MDITRELPYRTPEENMRLIMRYVCSQDKPVTRARIGHAINRKLNAKIVQEIEALVEWGYLEKSTFQHRKHVTGFKYKAGRKAYDDGWC